MMHDNTNKDLSLERIDEAYAMINKTIHAMYDNECVLDYDDVCVLKECTETLLHLSKLQILNSGKIDKTVME